MSKFRNVERNIEDYNDYDEDYNNYEDYDLIDENEDDFEEIIVKQGKKKRIKQVYIAS